MRPATALHGDEPDERCTRAHHSVDFLESVLHALYVLEHVERRDEIESTVAERQGVFRPHLVKFEIGCRMNISNVDSNQAGPRLEEADELQVLTLAGSVVQYRQAV